MARETTPSGFFTQLEVPSDFEQLSLPENFALDGCAIFAEQLDTYAECILHIHNGRVSSLEVHSVGSGHPRTCQAFEVRDIDVNRIDQRDGLSDGPPAD